MNNTTILCPEIQIDSGYGIYLHFCVIPAVTIILILAFLEKRKSTEHCNGRPGVLIPLYYLDGYYNRWSYACAFGSMSLITIAFISNYKYIIQIEVPFWAEVFLIYIVAIEICLDFYPLFACLSTPYKLVGGIFGLLYSLCWLIINLLWVAQDYCYYVSFPPGYVPMLIPVVTLLEKIPIVASLVFLAVRFSWDIIDSLRKGVYFHEDEAEIAKPHQLIYVRNLLSKNRPSSKAPEGRCSTVRYRREPGFRLSSRICATMFMTGVFLYWTAVSALLLGKRLFASIRRIEYMNITSLPVANQAIDAMEAWWFVVTVLTLILHFFYIYLTLVHYKKHMLKLYKGQKSFMPKITFTPGNILTDSICYPGNQVVYMVFGYVFAFLSVFVFGCIVVVVGFVLMEYPKLRNNLTVKVLQMLVICVISKIMLHYGQHFVRKYLLQKKLNPEDTDSPLAVDNRRIYENVNYYLLIVNFTVGLITVFKRLAVGFAIGLFMVGRMERTLLMRGYESLDEGYTSYLSMLILECTHNHPVLRVFCKLLIPSPTDAPMPHESPLLVNCEKVPRQNKLASNRWHLAYTLIKNPNLIVTRHGKYDPTDQSGRKFIINFANTDDDYDKNADILESSM